MIPEMLTTLMLAPPAWVRDLVDWTAKQLKWQKPDQFWSDYLIWPVIQIVVVLFLVLTIVAYLVYLERKVSAFMQARLGPMRVGPWGLLQPAADGIKLLLKEDIIPSGADRWVFLIAPAISVMAAFTVFAAIPFADNFFITDINI